ncbi:cytochrome P450 [Phellopilus nigrolimitatus]|nr:cytochrome P450 [Phellopilus nigrolimitatus]
MVIYLSIVSFMAGCLAIYVVKRLVYIATPSLPLPPGPKGLPLVGNIHDMPDPAGKAWMHWKKHKGIHGPISSVTVLGQTIIVLNDYSIASELLKKDNYADRPSFPFGGEMVGWENSLPMLHYGERLRQYRRNFHKFLGTRAAMARLTPLLEVETRRFLYRIICDPPSLNEQIRRTAGAIILKLSHGYTVEAEGPDPLINLASNVLDNFINSTAPGYWAVDLMPFLRYVPSWFPGAAFKRIAKEWRKDRDEFLELPHTFVKKQMATGTAQPSFTSTLLEEAKNEYDESCIKWSAGAVQRKAQAEIDLVIGNERLPTFADREEMPYIEAVLKESMRWNLVAPMALPHSALEESVYHGYLIPKGAIIIANCWEFGHNSDTYVDPMSFKPERFLGVDGREPELDPSYYVFGFGRRLCPGKEFADSSMWLMIAMTLATLDITKRGTRLLRLPSFTTGLFGAFPAAVDHYQCVIAPRSEKAAMLARSVEEEHPYEKKRRRRALARQMAYPRIPGHLVRGNKHILTCALGSSHRAQL